MAENEIRFDGRAILITGAGRGIGRAHALLLASRGAKVVVSDYGAAMDGEDPSSAPAQSVVAEIKAAGGEAVACTADIATEDGSNAAVAACVLYRYCRRTVLAKAREQAVVVAGQPAGGQ